MGNVKVSVITPSLNHGKYITSLLESVLAQDYPHIEHLVIDGYSCDETKKILTAYLERYKEHDKNLSVVYEKDECFVEAVNNGIKKSSGEIIIIQNADDYFFTPNAISIAVQTFQNYPSAGMIFGGELMVDEEGGMVKVIVPTDFAFKDLITSDYVIPQCSAFFRREVVDAVGLLNPRFDYYSDTEFWMRIGLKYPIIPFPTIISCYRTYRNQRSEKTGEHTKERLEMVLNFFENMELSLEIKKLRGQAIAGAIYWDAARVKSRLKSILYYVDGFIRYPRIKAVKGVMGRIFR